MQQLSSFVVRETSLAQCSKSSTDLGSVCEDGAGTPENELQGMLQMVTAARDISG